MSDEKKSHINTTIIKAKSIPIAKSSSSAIISDNNAILWIEPEVDMIGLKNMVNHSTILPQCIRAYKDNIAGFGIGVRYIDDIPETTQMKNEYSRLEAIIDQLNLEMDTKEVFQSIVEARESYGTAYVEVIRNVIGEVIQIEPIKETSSIKKSLPLGEILEVDYYYKAEQVKRQKQFRTYKQEKNGKTVYFKEFGDLRIMDKATGQYNDETAFEMKANEILEFALGSSSDYGCVRWIGQTLNVDGSRRAENLNNNYFQNGRHTPLMIIVNGGSLSEESFEKLQLYMDDIKGENGQHSFMVLECEGVEGSTILEGQSPPSVEIKDMASILQKDELFQDYLDNSRKKVQSAFRLPDLYVGYTSDFNRATAQTAQEVTEQQVFIPERKSLAWVINNKLLNGYGFKHVEVYFKEPDITNPDDMAKILSIAERAGGLSPNMAREIAFKTMGKSSENYLEDWGNIPIVVTKSLPQRVKHIDSAIEKAQSNNQDDIVVIMKEVKHLLQIKEG